MFGAETFSRGASERKGTHVGNIPPGPFLCCAVKAVFMPELELTSTKNALKWGQEAISRGDFLCRSSWNHSLGQFKYLFLKALPKEGNLKLHNLEASLFSRPE